MKVHFIGIGGIGVSALAQYYLSEGHKVSGSDLSSSKITDFVKKKGIKVIIGQKAKNISKDIDLVIYSPAVPSSNEELKRAKKLGIKTMSYPEALGKLTEEYFTIAVSGSHGKSTTTAIIALILIKAGIDPTVVIGTKLKELKGSNFRKGSSPTNFLSKLGGEKRESFIKLVGDKSDFLVIEACEYDDSFLNYNPNIILITNIDKEHLDYFKTFANVVKEFKKFILKLSKGGTLVLNKDDLGNKKLKLKKNLFNIINYSLKQKEYSKIKKAINVPGKHNISNSLGALEVARLLGVDDIVSLKAISEFKGTWRRFEERSIKINKKQVNLISDYGHHPNEIKATLQAAREKYKNKKIWLLFQPHQYQRTYYLFNDFVKVFKSSNINEIIITDIYDVAGRETKSTHSKVSSERLVEKINKNNVKYFSLSKAEKYIKGNIKSGEVLIVMGAGDIYKLAEKLARSNSASR